MSKQTKAFINILPAVALGVLAEILGRKIFANYDINYLIYGARLYMDQSVPWMNVWPGIDIIHGYLGKILVTPEFSILVVGILINVGASVSVNEIFRAIKAPRSYRYSAVFTTALFFKPTLGGWTADHISFLAGISSGIVFLLSDYRLSRRVFVCLGASVGLGLLLKLNSFTTSFGFTLLWILFSSIIFKRFRRDSLAMLSPKLAFATLAGFIFVVLCAHSLVLFRLELHLATINTYITASQSTASGQFGFERLAMLPLQVDLIEAFRSRQSGVLSFAPLIILFWLCLARSICVIIFSSSDQQRKLHAAALLLLLGSTFTALSLGRGLTHRLFLLPAGCILALSDISDLKQLKSFFPVIFGMYISLVWTAFAFVQKDFESNRIYDLKDIMSDRRTKSGICITGIHANGDSRIRHDKSPNILLFTSVENEEHHSLKCWSRDQVSLDFAGFMHTEEIANAIGITFQNHKALDGDYFEKWDWRKTLPEVRREWSINNAEYINNRKLGYFIERINISPEEYEVPGYFENIVPRKMQLKLLTEKTNAKLIGRLGRFNLWKTKWADYHTR